MTKYLRVTMPDGSKWDVPTEVIARDRVSYYAERDGFKEGSKEWKEEWDYTMSGENDYFTVRDWAANNMDWKDVVKHAKKVAVGGAEVDYQEGWVNGDKEVVEHD